MAKRPTDPKIPLARSRYEVLANLLALGRDDNGKPLERADAYLASGFDTQSRDVAIGNCSRLLRDSKNGIQARVDFLKKKLSMKQLRQASILDARRVAKAEDRQDEVHGLMSHLLSLAIEPKPKTNSSGKIVLDAEGEPVMEVTNFPAATKIVELMGVDAGMLVRQSRSGAIDDDYANLTDAELTHVFKAKLEAHGYDVNKRVEKPTEETPTLTADDVTSQDEDATRH